MRCVFPRLIRRWIDDAKGVCTGLRSERSMMRLRYSLLGAFVWNLDPVVVFIFLKCDQILKCGTAVVVCNRYRWIKRLAR